MIAQIEPAFQLNDMPFLYSAEAQAQGCWTARSGQLRKQLETKGVVPLGFMEGGFRHMINNVRPMSTPGGPQGHEVPRACRTRSTSRCSARSAATRCRWPGARHSRPCSRARSTGWRSRSAVIDQNKLYEVTKYLSLTGHIYSMIGLLIAKRSFDRLPADLKTAIVKAAAEATKQQRAASQAASQTVVRDSSRATACR